MQSTAQEFSHSCSVVAKLFAFAHTQPARIVVRLRAAAHLARQDETRRLCCAEPGKRRHDPDKTGQDILTFAYYLHTFGDRIREKVSVLEPTWALAVPVIFVTRFDASVHWFPGLRWDGMAAAHRRAIPHVAPPLHRVRTTRAPGHAPRGQNLPGYVV
jgi:hypothetical protein